MESPNHFLARRQPTQPCCLPRTPAAARNFFQAVATNASIEGGNKQVAIKVARGELAFGITDTDDAIIELRKGNPVSILFPDQGADAPGTLFIPNTLCVIKNGKNPEHAKKLVDYLLQPQVEERLRDGPSAQIPLNQALQKKLTANSNIPWSSDLQDLKVMDVDFQAAADAWDDSREELKKIFDTP